ncbi:MAG: ribonuclease HII [Bacteroidota bacterium]|nr:ribonuclease HII [Bacteroidota bacterium]MDP3144022.1 ribonuclease HII [Bacteroidota bacterium]MDP3557482.1 ribonuclease HII [Bacteroidota bacterium]
MLKSYFNKKLIEAGCDEAGRGCLAGPVYASAVILPINYKNKWLNDSKKLSDKDRYELRPEIEQNAISWAIGVVDHKEIDKINILNASFLAMHRAIDQLMSVPESLLIDGNRFKTYKNIPHNCIIKGDGKYLSIAAASILAKTYRDDFMKKMAIKHPEYNWDNNMGYPTKKHREAIKTHGVTPIHRLTFQLLPKQLELSL